MRGGASPRKLMLGANRRLHAEFLHDRVKNKESILSKPSSINREHLIFAGKKEVNRVEDFRSLRLLFDSCYPLPAAAALVLVLVSEREFLAAVPAPCVKVVAPITLSGPNDNPRPADAEK